jgi:hypothetical protein
VRIAGNRNLDAVEETARFVLRRKISVTELLGFTKVFEL